MNMNKGHPVIVPTREWIKQQEERTQREVENIARFQRKHINNWIKNSKPN
jgi:hypothetical protein